MSGKFKNITIQGSTHLIKEVICSAISDLFGVELFEDSVGNKIKAREPFIVPSNTGLYMEFEYSKEWIRTLEVTVTPKNSERGIVGFKWLQGEKGLSDFNFEGENILGLGRFFVTENGYYTVYIEDGAGYTAVESVHITTIDRKPPVLSLIEQEHWGTVSEITVNAKDDESGVKTLKWLQGVHASSDFANNGTDITGINRFNVAVNGVYTVFASDNVGNSTTSSITVSKIDTSTLGLSLKEQSGIGDYSLVEVEPIVGLSNLGVLKWREGVYHAKAFRDSGRDITKTLAVKALSNGVHTVYLEDNTGRYHTETIVVSNVDAVSPFTTIKKSSNWGNFSEVKVSMPDTGVEVTSINWYNGIKTVRELLDTGIDVSFTNTFTVSDDGLYTLSIKDTNDTVTWQKIRLEAIDSPNPTIMLLEQYSRNKSGELSGETIGSQTKPTMTLVVQPYGTVTTVFTILKGSNIPVSSVLWQEGVRVVGDFKSKGEDITRVLKFTAPCEGYYTVYVSDTEGNEYTQTIYIKTR